VSAAETEVIGAGFEAGSGVGLGESVERWLLLERLPSRADVYATADSPPDVGD
jgi:hypothetical protein